MGQTSVFNTLSVVLTDKTSYIILFEILDYYYKMTFIFMFATNYLLNIKRFGRKEFQVYQILPILNLPYSAPGC